MEFGILGPLEVRSGSAVLSIRRGLPRTVLVALLLRRGHTVSSDFLVDLLWGDALPRNPANALQIQVSYLRKTLGGAENGKSLLETRARWLCTRGQARTGRRPAVRSRGEGVL